MDERLRLLERAARHDPLARLRLHAERDRLLWPEGPPLSAGIDGETEALEGRIESLLAGVNGTRQSFRVEAPHVLETLARLDDLDEVEDVVSAWLRGTDVGYLRTFSASRTAHTVVLVVATAEHVAVGAAKGTERYEAGFCFVRPDPRGRDGYMGELVSPRSPPAILREWIERGSCVRLSREAVERWTRRRRGGTLPR